MRPTAWDPCRGLAYQRRQQRGALPQTARLQQAHGQARGDNAWAKVESTDAGKQEGLDNLGLESF